MITPMDIEQKVFSSGIKGYKKEEVDQFLDEIMLDMEALISENRKQKKLLVSMKQELDASREKENTLVSTLERARVLMNDISASAEKRAEIIIKNAKDEAADIVSEAEDSISNLKDESKMLKANIAGLKIKYKDMLTDELNKLDGRAEDWFNDLRQDFFPASMTMPEGNKREAEIAALSDKTVVISSELMEKAEAGEIPPEHKTADIEDLDPNILKVAEKEHLEEKELVDPAVEAGLFSDEEGEDPENTKGEDCLAEEMPEPAEESSNDIDDLKADDAEATEDANNAAKVTLSDVVPPKGKEDNSFSSDATTVIIDKDEMNQDL